MHVLFNLEIRLRATHHTCVWIYPAYRYRYALTKAELRRMVLDSANGPSLLSIEHP